MLLSNVKSGATELITKLPGLSYSFNMLSHHPLCCREVVPLMGTGRSPEDFSTVVSTMVPCEWKKRGPTCLPEDGREEVKYQCLANSGREKHSLAVCPERVERTTRHWRLEKIQLTISLGARMQTLAQDLIPCNLTCPGEKLEGCVYIWRKGVFTFEGSLGSSGGKELEIL